MLALHLELELASRCEGLVSGPSGFVAIISSRKWKQVGRLAVISELCTRSSHVFTSF